MQQKVVIIGGPGTGKSTLLNELSKRGYNCMPEISREVILAAQKKGIDQLFLTEPLLFSNLLLEGREKQYLEAQKSKDNLVFFDRGIPDIHAYLEFLKTDYPSCFLEKSSKYKYTEVFILPPWKEIYISDNERYESFEQAIAIYHQLKKTYKKIGYTIHTLPFGSVTERTDYLLNSITKSV
ncbi:MAG: ATP-binding protein [Flavobacteriaceae bacterium]|nr:ATP-binding protein [Flavobacteriaceae bacterium]